MYKPTKVTLAGSDTMTLDIDKTLKLNASLQPATAKTTLTWSSSSTKIATVKNGVVTPIKEGTVTITVKTANGLTDTVKVKVVKASSDSKPGYTELKPAICSATEESTGHGWFNDHPVVQVIDGLKVTCNAQSNPYQDFITGGYGCICGKTGNVELHDYYTGWSVVLKEGAPYSIYGFYPGMTLSEAKKVDSNRSDVSIGKTYESMNGLKYKAVTPKEKLGYLDTDILLYYDAKTEIIKYVEYTYFIGN